MRRSFKKGKKLFASRFSGEQSASVEGKLIYTTPNVDIKLEKFNCFKYKYFPGLIAHYCIK